MSHHRAGLSRVLAAWLGAVGCAMACGDGLADLGVFDSPPDPCAAGEATMVSGSARFTVLTPALLRLEWSDSGRFEDRASLLVLNRRLPAPALTMHRDAGWLEIETKALRLRYREGAHFAEDSLSIELRTPIDGRTVVWHPGQSDAGNLGGTARSLDGCDGATVLEPGLLSRDGWVLIDDSPRAVFSALPANTGGAVTDVVGTLWPTARQPGVRDWYFLGYGREYARALQDFTRVAGRVPLPPAWTLGAWWSRYWRYSAGDFRELLAEFRQHDVPLDVLVLDMDWHLVKAWSGYTWNRELFPDPQAFLRWAHDEGLHVTLNLHPGFDIESFETRFADFASALGVDPATPKVKFEHGDARFAAAYLRHLLHPLERDGVDFWWLDFPPFWTKTTVAGVDALWWLNHLHWVDQQRRARVNPSAPRPLILSRWGGLGNHRHPLGFSGDTRSTWASLAFQPYFTATAGNVLAAWWSHDLGGHMPGPVDPELYVRWLQFGALSPLMRTHATSSPQAERRIWAFESRFFEAGRAAYRLRYELLPYIAAAARSCYQTGLPLCRPLYYEWPDEPRAYQTPNEYLFGPDLLVVPVVAPGNPTSGAARVRVWLPTGHWIDWFTGERRTGPAEFTTLAPLDRVLLYVRDGAIIPTTRPQRNVSATMSGEWILNVFPAARSAITLPHDDGVSNAYRTGNGAQTEVRSEYDAASRRVTVHIVAGGGAALDGAPGHGVGGGGTRAGYELRVRSGAPPMAVRRDGVALRRGAERGAADWHFDAETFATVVPVRDIDQSSCSIEFEFEENAGATEALDTGLRAALQSLERAARALGERTPADVRGVLARWHAGLADGAAVTALAHDVLGRWDEHVRSLLAVRDAPEAADGVLMLLLGLDYDVTVGDVNDDARSATLAVRLSSTPPLGSPPPIRGRIEIEPPQFHRLDGNGVAGGEVPVGGRGFEVTRKLTWGAPVRTDRARVRIAFETPGRAITAIVEPVLFPSINAWWVIGPFDCPFAESLERVLPPERELDVTATYEGKNDKRIAWQKIERPLVAGASVTDEFAIDLNKVCGASDNAVAYALTYLHAPAAQEAVLALGSDDGVQVWLNGAEIHRKRLVRPYGARQDFVPLALRAGSNTLLLKVSQGAGGWGFGAHVEDAAGAPRLEIEPRLVP